MNIRNLVFPLVVLAIFMFALGVIIPRRMYIDAHPDIAPVVNTSNAVVANAPIAQASPPVLPQQTSATSIVTTTSAPVQFAVTVPPGKSAIPKALSSGKQRIEFEFDAKDAARATALFQRGGVYYLTVTK